MRTSNNSLKRRTNLIRLPSASLIFADIHLQKLISLYDKTIGHVLEKCGKIRNLSSLISLPTTTVSFARRLSTLISPSEENYVRRRKIAQQVSIMTRNHQRWQKLFRRTGLPMNSHPHRIKTHTMHLPKPRTPATSPRQRTPSHSDVPTMPKSPSQVPAVHSLRTSASASLAAG